ncbi:hypothetical protein ABPG75_009723 [Micractinium tetrahymenae]
MGNGEVAAGAIFMAILAALGWSFLASLWASFLENFIPFLFVALALAAASGWGFLGLNGNGVSFGGSTAATRRRPPPGQGSQAPGLPPALPPPQPQRTRGGPGAGQQQQQQGQGQGQEQQLRRTRRGSSGRQLLEGAGQEVELARVSGSSGAGSRRIVPTAPGNGSASSSRSASSQALVPAADNSLALIEVASFSCPKPLGCGFRHGCPDTQRSWMACDRHSYHPAPPEGSVWREVVPDGQPSAGSYRLLLCWGGRVLDATELGHCRGWDRQITDIVSGTNAAG